MQPISVDVRVIAATNRELSSAIKEGWFRGDLYYRLNVIPIRLPPLRERKEEVPVLGRFFLRRFAAETKKNFSGISKEAEAWLLAYDWPGNVRELANVIERAVVLGQGPQVTARDLSPRSESPLSSSFNRRAVVSSCSRRCEGGGYSPCACFHPRQSRRRCKNSRFAQNASVEPDEVAAD